MELKKTAQEKLKSFKPKEKLKGLIPSRHMAKWKLIAEVSLVVIIIVGLFEIAHWVFHVKFSEDFLAALELIDYFAVFLLGVDLFNHYLITPNKDKFIKNKFIYILSFIPYLIFTKTMGALYLLKPVLTGIAKLIKIFSHKEEIQEKMDDVKEDIQDITKKKKTNQEKPKKN